MDFSNHLTFAYDDVDDAFPPCDPKFRPTGNRVLVQLRTPKKKTKGGIILTEDVRDTEHYNTQVAKVLRIGNLAFKDRDRFVDWPEGPWFAVGDFVRVPRYGVDNWTTRGIYKDEEVDVVLVLLKETDVGGVFEGDPTEVRAFL